VAVQDRKRKACVLARDGDWERVGGAIGTRQKEEAQRVTRLLLCIVLKRNAQIITNYRSKERVQKPRMGRKAALVFPQYVKRCARLGLSACSVSARVCIKQEKPFNNPILTPVHYPTVTHQISIFDHGAETLCLEDRKNCRRSWK